jgi:hypothetical protein
MMKLGHDEQKTISGALKFDAKWWRQAQKRQIEDRK